MNISKFIPAAIKIKSLYWVRKEKEISDELSKLFGMIDDENYAEATVFLSQLREKWEGRYLPDWFGLEYPTQFTRAEVMISFLTSPVLDDEEDDYDDDDVFYIY
jgi:hypothetical protein